MANVETRRDENTFLGSWWATYEHIFYERRLDHVSLFSIEIWALGKNPRGGAPVFLHGFVV